MELTQHSLLEELIMTPKIDPSSFPTELLQNSWNFSPLNQTPDLHLPATNYYHPSVAELSNNPCHLGEFEFQPFLEALTSPELGSFYDLQQIDCAGHLEMGESLFLENGWDGGMRMSMSSCCKVESAQMNDYAIMEKKSKSSKKTEGQPSKNLMAERRRRKRLNDRLSMLRSIVPKISKMDRTSILGDTIDYMRELLEKIDELRDDDESSTTFFKNHNMQQLRNPPKFEVERRTLETRIEVCCAPKPGLLLSTLSTLDALALDVQQCVISCFNDFSVQASCFEAEEQRSLLSSEDVKQALFRNAGYGGRCL